MYLFLSFASSLSSFSAIVDDSSTLLSSSVLDWSSSLQSCNVCSANLLNSVEKIHIMTSWITCKKDIITCMHSSLLISYQHYINLIYLQTKRPGLLSFSLICLFAEGACREIKNLSNFPRQKKKEIIGPQCVWNATATSADSSLQIEWVYH